MGIYLQVRESELDAITAVSGSGPAYLFLFVEAMVEAAKQQGFSDEVALLLAKGTVVGSSKLLETSGLDPSELRRQVTSPGGTTQAAIERFQADGFAALVARAVQAAHDRSVELGQLD
jgi:pyrroline-5-carboxylate reductase